MRTIFTHNFHTPLQMCNEISIPLFRAFVNVFDEKGKNKGYFLGKNGCLNSINVV